MQLLIAAHRVGGAKAENLLLDLCIDPYRYTQVMQAVSFQDTSRVLVTLLGHALVPSSSMNNADQENAEVIFPIQPFFETLNQQAIQLYPAAADNGAPTFSENTFSSMGLRLF